VDAFWCPVSYTSCSLSGATAGWAAAASAGILAPSLVYRCLAPPLRGKNWRLSQPLWKCDLADDVATQRWGCISASSIALEENVDARRWRQALRETRLGGRRRVRKDASGVPLYWNGGPLSRVGEKPPPPWKAMVCCGARGISALASGVARMGINRLPNAANCIADAEGTVLF